MLIVVAYDVSVVSEHGARRLSRIAKICKRYGQRVQNSVFECSVDMTQFAELKAALTKVMNPKEDSLRFYNLGDRYQNRITHLGTKTVRDINEPLLF